MKLNADIENLPTLILDIGVTAFDLLFIIPIVWLTYRGIKKGFSSIYWLAGNVIGMLVLVKATKPIFQGIIDDLLAKNPEINDLPIPTSALNHMIGVTVGVLVTIVGLIVLNIILVVVYQFVKKKFKTVNDSMGSVDSKVVGGVSGLALGVFVASALSSLVYAPVWGNYNHMVENSMGHKMTSELQSSFFGAEETVSVDTINLMIDGINVVMGGENTTDQVGGILDIIEGAAHDPILGDLVNDIVEGILEDQEDLIPSITPTNPDAAYDDLTKDIFGEGSTLTDAEKQAALEALLGEDFPSDHYIPELSEDVAHDLACKMLTDADTGVKPAACTQ